MKSDIHTNNFVCIRKLIILSTVRYDQSCFLNVQGVSSVEIYRRITAVYGDSVKNDREHLFMMFYPTALLLSLEQLKEQIDRQVKENRCFMLDALSDKFAVCSQSLT